MNHKITRTVLALAIGLGLAWYAYDRATDLQPRQQRATEEVVVAQVRIILRRVVAPDSELEIVDPLSPNRRAGKSYLSPTEDGWAVSGFYRRGDADPWHPWLMKLDSDMQLQSLSVQDASPRLVELASEDKRIEARP